MSFMGVARKPTPGEKKLLTSEMIKNFALKVAKADLVGIANVERFKDAPDDMQPLRAMPRARSVVVIGNRILRGCHRGIDEGTHWPSYGVFGYTRLAETLVRAAYKISRFIEDYGYEAASTGMGASSREIGPRGPAPSAGKPAPDVVVHL